jgi:hypothetical protein
MMLHTLCQQGCHVGSSAGFLVSIVGRQLYVHFGYPFTNEQLTTFYYPSRFGSRWDAMDDKMRLLYGLREGPKAEAARRSDCASQG